MPLVEIRVGAAATRGHVAASVLPRVLRCRACDHVARLVRKGLATIRAQYTEDAVDADPRWSRYDEGFAVALLCQQQKRKQRPRKRVLKPRVAETV